MQNEKSQELRGISAQLSEDGSINLAGNKLWMVPAEERDKAYIISTWIRSYQPISRKLRHVMAGRVIQQFAALGVDDDAYKAHHPAIAEALWSKSLVLKDDVDGSAIHGYICHDLGGTLHYVYIVPELRRLGLCKELIRSACGDSPVLSHFWPHKWPASWKYNPYLSMRYGKE